MDPKKRKNEKMAQNPKIFYHFIMGKIGPKFSHLLTVRAEGADPPPPHLYGQSDRKKAFFFTPLDYPENFDADNSSKMPIIPKSRYSLIILILIIGSHPAPYVYLVETL